MPVNFKELLDKFDAIVTGDYKAPQKAAQAEKYAEEESSDTADSFFKQLAQMTSLVTADLVSGTQELFKNDDDVLGGSPKDKYLSYIFNEKGDLIDERQNNSSTRIIIKNSLRGDIIAELNIGQIKLTYNSNTGFSSIKNINIAQQIYEFLSDNTKVEWAWGIDDILRDSDIFTTEEGHHIKNSSTKMDFYKIFVHNHPSGDARSSKQDKETSKLFPKINFYIYVKGNKSNFPKGYYQFNIKGMYNKQFKNKGNAMFFVFSFLR